MSVVNGRFADFLPELQAIASRSWSPTSWQHAGQLAWSAIFVDPDSPVVIFDGEAFGWFDAPESLEIGGNPEHLPEVIEWALSRAAKFRTCVCDGPIVEALVALGGVVADGPFFVQQTLDIAGITVPEIAGYELRHVEPNEFAECAACHRAAWSEVGPSSVTAEKYGQLMRTQPYDSRLDWVAVDGSGTMVASALLWRDGHSTLVEPVGCIPEHRRRGLAGAVTLAALAAAHEMGATVGLVRPRGDDGYPNPARLYRKLGFVDKTRTRTVGFN